MTLSKNAQPASHQEHPPPSNINIISETTEILQHESPNYHTEIEYIPYQPRTIANISLMI